MAFGAKLRFCAWVGAGWLLLGGGAGFGLGLARADVLEVSVGAAHWVAGAPAYAQGAAANPRVGDAPQQTPHLPGNTALGNTSFAPVQWQQHLSIVAARHNLDPALLEALVWQESRWRTQAVSPVGARGLTQLMPATARELGVDADDPLANLEGGARYLRQQLDAFQGDLVKALAAYNAGAKRVQRAGGVPAIAETQNYVAAILGRLTANLGR